MAARKAPPVAKPAFVKVATIDQIPPGHSHLVEIDDVRVAIFNLRGELYAVEDVCTHDGGPLVEGVVVNDCEVKCPRHGARFDIRSGAALSFPAIRPTQTFAVRIEGGNVLIEAPA
jgi:3-phenylpropionate/trans-cinnamate dioxygenase ferredoxin subunit